jgi:hypothetical protein
MESELEQAKRQVAEGRRLIAAQEDMIKSLKAQGKPTRNAELNLETFKSCQARFEDHLKAIMPVDTAGRRSNNSR